DQAGSDPHQAGSIQLPLPDGSLALFHFWETPVMEAPLAAKFPYQKQYTAVQVNRPQVSAKLNIDSSGFHAMIFDGEQSAFIEPLDDIFGTRNYLSFYKSAIHPPRPEACAIENEEALKL